MEFLTVLFLIGITAIGGLPVFDCYQETGHRPRGRRRHRWSRVSSEDLD